MSLPLSSRVAAFSAATAASLESLEPRRLMTFATVDGSFGGGGGGGIAEHDFSYSPSSTFSALTPMADGRIVLADQTKIRFLRGDGTLDPKRSGGGIDFKESVLDVHVDPPSGRFAVLRRTREHGQDNYGLSLDAYDPKGRRVATRVLDDDFADANTNATSFGSFWGVGVAIAPDGSTVVAVPSVPESDGSPGDYSIEVRRYNALLTPDSSYGDSGIARQLIFSGFVVNSNWASVSNVFLDASGRAYVGYRTAAIHGNPGRGKVESKMLRLTQGGEVDTTYGTGGVATFYSYVNNHAPDPENPVPVTVRTRTELGGLDVQVMPDGRAYMATREVILPGDASESVYTQFGLLRLNADGRGRAEAAVGREMTGQPGAPMRLAVHDGDVYVSSNAFGGTATIFKYNDDGSSLRVDDAWSNFGDFAITSSDRSADASGIDRNGRLLLAGGLARTEVVAINGTTETPAGRQPTGTIKRLADGTIFVNGTSKADKIDVGTKRGRLRITLNGKTTDFGHVVIRGLIISAGNGDDRVTIGTAIDNVYVEAGAGNDDVSSSARIGDATLIGGSGNDRLVGGDSTDHIYGQGGKDTLVGGGAADELFGGDDVDQLFASSLVTNLATKTYDGLADRLDSGAGADIVHVDRDVRATFNDSSNQTTYSLKAVDLVLGNTTGDSITGR